MPACRGQCSCNEVCSDVCRARRRSSREQSRASAGRWLGFWRWRAPASSWQCGNRRPANLPPSSSGKPLVCTHHAATLCSELGETGVLQVLAAGPQAPCDGTGRTKPAGCGEERQWHYASGRIVPQRAGTLHDLEDPGHSRLAPAGRDSRAASRQASWWSSSATWRPLRRSATLPPGCSSSASTLTTWYNLLQNRCCGSLRL